MNYAFAFRFMMLLAAQILVWNYCNFTQFLLIAFLPAMILMLPARMSSMNSMLIAFVCGVIADFLGSAPMGLTSLALVPVAFARNFVIRLVFGSDVYLRGDEISSFRQGWPKVLLATVIVTSLFLIVYIAADSAGTRPFWIDIVKFAVSLTVSTGVSMLTGRLSAREEDSGRWR